MKEGRIAVVTSAHIAELRYTHCYDIGERVKLLGTEVFDGEQVYHFENERGLRQTLFGNQFRWLGGNE